VGQNLSFMDPMSQYGLNPATPPAGAAAPNNTALPAVPAGAGISGTLSSLANPNNPMFWLGVFLAATLGAIGFATEARVGPVKGEIKVGKE
jgi:hypothetical protein